MDDGRYERRTAMDASAAAASESPHILLIDDVPEDIRATLVLLKAQPWRISLASDAHQGYHRALALRPDLIVLDVHMPHMNGFSLCRLLREAPSTGTPPSCFCHRPTAPLNAWKG